MKKERGGREKRDSEREMFKGTHTYVVFDRVRHTFSRDLSRSGYSDKAERMSSLSIKSVSKSTLCFTMNDESAVVMCASLQSRLNAS